MSFLTKLFSGNASTLIDSVSKGIDSLTMSKEEKEQFKIDTLKAINDHQEKLAVQAQAELDSYLKDTQSARDANVAIQNSDKASWLSKNVGYIIDLFLTILWGTITLILFLKIFKVAAESVDMISLMALHGTVTAVFMTIVNFHRGTSKTSADKDKTIHTMVRK